jgi:protein-disulfide isomerase
LLGGIPQHGVVLGSPKAPVTLVEYADLQCPFCAEWSQRAFPTVVREYVRTGRVQLVFRGLDFIGGDSTRALRAALAAAAQNKLWNVVQLLYLNRGSENSGWVTDDLLREVGKSVSGLDLDQYMAERSSSRVTRERAKQARLADANRIDATPSFQIGLTGGRLRLLNPGGLGAGPVRRAVRNLLAHRGTGVNAPFGPASRTDQTRRKPKRHATR